MSATSVPVCQGLLFSFFLNYEPHKCKAQGFRQSHPVPVIYLLPLSSRFTRNMVYDLYDLCMVCIFLLQWAQCSGLAVEGTVETLKKEGASQFRCAQRFVSSCSCFMVEQQCGYVRTSGGTLPQAHAHSKRSSVMALLAQIAHAQISNPWRHPDNFYMPAPRPQLACAWKIFLLPSDWGSALAQATHWPPPSNDLQSLSLLSWNLGLGNGAPFQVCPS